jgi:signal-transduction protein with cAMP-binding, CBS, and nucleotidyltransferase domain
VQLIDVVKYGKRRAFSPGETVISAGEISGCMYVICRGTVSCQDSGKEVRQITFANSFGDMKLVFRQVISLLHEHEEILGDAGPRIPA